MSARIERLEDICKKGINELKNLSKRLNAQTSTLDCKEVRELEASEMKALFSNIRPEWRRQQELDNFIDTDSIDDLLWADFNKYLDQPVRSINSENSLVPIGVIVSLSIILGIFLIDKAISKPPEVPISKSDRLPTLEAKKLKIGFLGQSNRYAELKIYLHQKFGDRVKIYLDDSVEIANQTTKGKMLIEYSKIKLRVKNWM